MQVELTFTSHEVEHRVTQHLSALLAQRARFAAITAEKEAHGVLGAHVGDPTDGYDTHLARAA